MARTYVWMMAVVMVLAIVVAENGRVCVADDNNDNDQNKEDKSVMKELHDKAESWTDWARNKISGKWSTDESTEGGHSVESSSKGDNSANLLGNAGGPGFRSTNAGFRNSGDQDGHDHQ